ncbi:MAG: hypothetical protein UGF91_01005 [Dialister invisus]|nr:hypothetical protein [Dialister invisus]
MAIAGRVAIVPKGDWSADATYKRLDAVTYNNTLYFAKKDVPAGTATNNTEYWSRSIVGGAGAIATKEDAGTVKPADGLTVAEDGTLKVSIDGTTLTMDQVNNVIKLADTLKDKINGAFPAANLINNLTTTEAGFGLDARQGKALDDKITEINGSKKIPSFGIENIFTGNPFCIVNNGSDVISVQTDWDIDNGGYRVKNIKYPAGTATNLTVSLSLPANSIVIVDVNTLNGENIDIQGSLIRSNFTSSPKNWSLSIKFTGRTNQTLTDIRYMPLVIHLG